MWSYETNHDRLRDRGRHCTSDEVPIMWVRSGATSGTTHIPRPMMIDAAAAAEQRFLMMERFGVVDAP